MKFFCVCVSVVVVLRQFPLSRMLLFWRITIVFPHVLFTWTYNNSVFFCSPLFYLWNSMAFCLSVAGTNAKFAYTHIVCVCVCVWLKSMVFTHFWHKTMTHFSLTALWRLLLWKWEQSTRSKTNGQTSIYKRNNSWTTELFIRFRNGTVETITAVGLGADTFLVEMWENLPHLEAYWHRSKMHLHSESREEIQRLLTKRSHNIQILTWFTWHQMIS